MNENPRKIVHIIFGLPIFLLLILNWWQASLIALLAFIHNLLVFPLYAKSLFRGRWDRGIILYPLSILIVIVLFRQQIYLAASAWALLSFSDGFASLAGKRSSKKLPWNEQKTYAGTTAFAISGVIFAPFFYWLIKGSLTSKELFIILFAVILTAFFESFKTGVDDNIIVPFSFLYFFKIGETAKFPGLTSEIVAIILFITLLSVLAYLFKLLDAAGSLTAFFIGGGILVFGGISIFVILLSFFILSEVATFYRKNEKISVKRGWESVMSKGGPPLLFSILGFPHAAAISLAEAAYDTVAAEFGSVAGSITISLPELRRTERGSPGGISPEGTVAGILAAVVIIGISTLVGIKLNFLYALVLIVGINLFEPILKNPCQVSHSFSNFLITYLAGEVYLLIKILL